MKSRMFIAKMFSFLLVCMVSMTQLFAVELSLDKENEDLTQQIIEQLNEMARLAQESEKQPFVISNAQVLSVIAYTHTDFSQPWVDEKVVYIPEGWSYYTHGHHETTGNGIRKIYEPWVVRDQTNPSRIIEVHIKVEAFPRWFARSWVGAQLDVIIQPLNSN